MKTATNAPCGVWKLLLQIWNLVNKAAVHLLFDIIMETDWDKQSPVFSVEHGLCIRRWSLINKFD